MINSYGDKRFRIAGTIHAGSVIVFPDRTIPWYVFKPVQIDLDCFTEVIEAAEKVDLLLVGVGNRFRPPPPGLRPALKERGIVAEWMDTGAACRTFNVLLGEERSVAAALIAV